MDQVGGPNPQKPKKANTNYEPPHYAVFFFSYYVPALRLKYAP